MAGLQAPLSTLRLAPRDALRSSIDQRSKEKRLMTSRMRQQQSDGFLTIRNAWMEGKTLTLRDPVSVFETNFNNLLNLLGGKETSTPLSPEGSAARPVTIVNKLSDSPRSSARATKATFSRPSRRPTAISSLLQSCSLT